MRRSSHQGRPSIGTGGRSPLPVAGFDWPPRQELFENRVIQRREILKMGAGGGLAGMALGMSSGAAAAEGPGRYPLKTRQPRRPLLINRARAQSEMTKAGLDGMIVREPSNVYYATNHWSVFTDYGSMQPSYAIIPRQADRPVIAVTPWIELWKLAEDDAEYGQIIIYDPRVAKADPRRTSFNRSAVVKGAELGVVEKTLLEAAESYMAGAVPTETAGIAKALKESGLTTGRIGVDDMRIQVELGAAGFEGPTLVSAEPMMYRIRQVKTAPEIALLGRAAQISADAATAAIKRLEVGATLEDLRAMFRAEAGLRGAGYINIAGGGPDFPTHHIEAGRPFMIDAVATVDRYCGDFGRTVVLGEPTQKISQAAKRASAAWEGVFAQMKPGMRFSEIRDMGRAAAAKAGFDITNFGSGAHSVGLQHSEDPREGDTPEDFVMEAGMVISVDHPYTEWGWGTSHLEDLTVITETGAEALNLHTDPLIVV